MNKLLMLVLIVMLLTVSASANSVYVYETGKGNGNGTFNTYTGITCTNLNATSPCARYDESTLRIDMDRDTVKYQVQNNLGVWRYIQYDIPNPTNMVPTISTNPKSIIWMGMYANNTNLRYVMKPHGIKLDIWGNGTPPNNYFNFTYTVSTGVQPKKKCQENESCEIQFYDNNTNELLWIVAYPNMKINGINIPLEFKKDNEKIIIHAPDLFTNPYYNFSAGWELDPSTYSPTSGGTIYISDRQNLTQVYNDIANDTALTYDGSGNCLLNANLINNNTANRFFMNDTDSLCYKHLRINSTVSTFWYYRTDGQTKINNFKITSWDTTVGTVNTNSGSPRSYIYAYDTSSKMNISNSNVSYLGYSGYGGVVYTYGVIYQSSNNNIIIDSVFINNYIGLYFWSSSHHNNITNTTILSSVYAGILCGETANYLNILNLTITSYHVGGYLYSSYNNITNSNITSIDNHGLYLTGSSYNTVTNSILSSSGIRSGLIIYYNSNYNTILNSTATSVDGIGLRIQNSNHNNVINSTGISTNSYGLYIASESYDNLTNSTGISASGNGILVSDSNNVLITNGSYLSQTSISYYLLGPLTQVLFNNTNFTVPRTIFFYDSVSVFQYDDGKGIWVKTAVSLGQVQTTRTLLNWNQSNVSWIEQLTYARTILYNVSGLSPACNYYVYNGSSLDYQFTTDSNGVLTPFTINFSTTAKTVKIVLAPVIDTSFTISLPSGITQAFFNATSKSSKNVNASDQNVTAGFLYITNTGNVALDFYAIINSSQPAGVALKGSTDNNPAGESVVSIDASIVKIIDAIPVSESQYFWLWVDYSNALPMAEQRLLSVNSSQ